MRKFIAIAMLVSLLALAGCAQGQSSASVRASDTSVSATETRASAASASAMEARSSAASAGVSQASAEAASSNVAEDQASFFIGIGNERLVVKPADTEAARALMGQLQAGPVAVNLHAYGGFEQVGPLPWSLPASDEQITTAPGDIMLYQGNQITIFTGSNSWAYTPLGSIEGATSEMLHEAFGGDAVEITLSLA